MKTYDEEIKTTWIKNRLEEEEGEGRVEVNKIAGTRLHQNRLAIMEEIVRCGTLAPSSHNTQCWKFGIELDNAAAADDRITIKPDFTRRCPVVDPDDHHLWVSLGCAVENVIVAAKHYGMPVKQIDTKSLLEKGIAISLSKSSQKENTATTTKLEDDEALYEAIFNRQCTRTEYDGQPISEEEVDILKKVCSDIRDVQMQLYTDESSKQMILEYIIQANKEQLSSPEFRSELKSWVRFGESEAVQTKDGMYGKCMGNPSIPRWIGKYIFDFVCKPESENAKIQKQVNSSAGLAVFSSKQKQGVDPVQWIKVGRCYERFALQTTAMGIKNAFFNQPVEIPTIRSKLAHALLGSSSGMEPDLVVRFGKGPRMPQSLRRTVESVLDTASTGSNS